MPHQKTPLLMSSTQFLVDSSSLSICCLNVCDIDHLDTPVLPAFSGVQTHPICIGKTIDGMTLRSTLVFSPSTKERRFPDSMDLAYHGSQKAGLTKTVYVEGVPYGASLLNRSCSCLMPVEVF